MSRLCFSVFQICALACVICVRPAVAQSDAASMDLDVAAKIDEMLERRWQAKGVTPAEPASEEEFLRRVWLDLAGTIPPLNEKSDEGDFGIRGFLDDERTDKRLRLIDHLLARPSYGSHMAAIWTNIMVPDDSVSVRYGSGFYNWLRHKFRINDPYDRLVSELIRARGAPTSTGPILFYTSNEVRPGELAGATSRVFMGVQIQCAQCHDHPFDDWSRSEFWEFAAFFAQLEQPEEGQGFAYQVADSDSGEVMYPDTETVVEPRFLDGLESPDDDRTRRERLAEWLTSPDNEYFARAAANRVWALMFGQGLIDPVDDLGDHNPASVPEVLELLTEHFIACEFDLKRLFRTIALTEAYQRTSRNTNGDDERPELFSRMSLKALTAEQLYDSLAEAIKTRETRQFGRTREVARGVDQNRLAFISKFRAPTLRSVDYEAGIPQALTLMNGNVISNATDILESDILTSLESPFFNDAKRLDILFLSTLTRKPTELEREELMPYIRSGGVSGDRREAFSDILWALLNSAEFVFNH